MEKLEGEKVVIEQQNRYLQERLAQMEAENSRLSKQVAQLSADVRNSPASSVKSDSRSPTLTATLFKQEIDGDSTGVPPFTSLSPSSTERSPTLEPPSLAEPADLTQHPAAVLCDLQCRLVVSKERGVSSLSTTPTPNVVLQMVALQLYLTMTSTAYSILNQPSSRTLLHSTKTGSESE